jgi:hypothetical protein
MTELKRVKLNKEAVPARRTGGPESRYDPKCVDIVRQMAEQRWGFGSPAGKRKRSILSAASRSGYSSRSFTSPMAHESHAGQVASFAEAQIQVERKSSAELLDELYNKLLELSRCGDADRRHPRYCEH